MSLHGYFCFRDRALIFRPCVLVDTGSLGRMVTKPNCHQDELKFIRKLETDLWFLSFLTGIAKNYFNNKTRINSLCIKEGKNCDLNISSFSAKNYFGNYTRKNEICLKEGKNHAEGGHWVQFQLSVKEIPLTFLVIVYIRACRTIYTYNMIIGSGSSQLITVDEVEKQELSQWGRNGKK